MCWYCGNNIEGSVYRNTTCGSCGKDAKVCKNCTFFEPGAHWDCRETIQEPVREKERANFCDYFVYTNRTPGGENTSRQEKARDTFNSLFGDE